MYFSEQFYAGFTNVMLTLSLIKLGISGLLTSRVLIKNEV